MAGKRVEILSLNLVGDGPESNYGIKGAKANAVLSRLGEAEKLRKGGWIVTLREDLDLIPVPEIDGAFYIERKSDGIHVGDRQPFGTTWIDPDLL
ncbi:MAG: hypothetical protein WC841_01130 [Candidatus Shapirobacteria bacterium]|jgi:hypothetical protein